MGSEALLTISPRRVLKSASLSLAGNWGTEMADTMPNTLLWLAWLLSSEDEKKARELALTQTQYEIVDDILYHVEGDKTLRVILP